MKDLLRAFLASPEALEAAERFARGCRVMAPLMENPFTFKVFAAECLKHGKARVATSEEVYSFECPKCGRTWVTRKIGDSTVEYPWTFIDKRTGAAGGRKAGEARRGEPTKARLRK